MANADDLNEIIAAWVATFETAAEVEAAIGFSSVLVADVRTAQEIRDTDWAEERGAFIDVPVKPGGDAVTIPQSPWRFSRAEAGADPVVGFRGEHNREILREVFGLSAEQLDDLEAREVISSRLPDWK